MNTAEKKHMDTSEAYDAIISQCKELFLKKAADYGTAWRIMRLPSVTDQIFIKAQRIRTIENNQFSKISDDISSEYIGIINYCIIAMIQLELPPDAEENLPITQVQQLYDHYVAETKELMLAKNHDYGEAWRDLRIGSLTDLILMKIFRVKQIEDNSGKTLVSEGVKANYQDMLNYAIFALLKLSTPLKITS
ncbi:DUF1599 domain-containing protein [Olivibacter ginsenosidimutans]|uniref:DUF1599 domain-containing protein n=2 Tax=Olivibacter ginsenosidimutans TaxID=1176537 RepID=A0ABP9BMY9_9SPHI